MELQFEEEHKPDIEDLIESEKKETSTEKIKRLTGFDIGLCTKCKKGRMHVIREIPRCRAPPGNLPSILLSKLQ